MSLAGYDGDDRACLPPLSLQEANLPQSIPRTVHQPRDEPLHSMLSLRPLLPRLRRRARPRRNITLANGICRRRRRCVRIAAWAVTPFPASGMANYGESSTATTTT